MGDIADLADPMLTQFANDFVKSRQAYLSVNIDDESQIDRRANEHFRGKKGMKDKASKPKNMHTESNTSLEQSINVSQTEKKDQQKEGKEKKQAPERFSCIFTQSMDEKYKSKDAKKTESSNSRESTTPPLLKEIQSVTPISTSNTNTKIIKVKKKTQHKENVDISGENDQCDCNAANFFHIAN